MNPVQVAYIVGAGRSGSTWLNIVLGHHRDIVDVGELSHFQLYLDGGSAECSCGHQAGECSFWSEVIALWSKRVGQKEVKAYPSLVHNVERSIRGELVHRRRRTVPEIERYAQLTYALYDCIRLCSGRQIIVDSSKSSKRALALARVPGLQMRYVHLVRDPRAVVWSMVKKQRRRKERKPDKYGGTSELRTCVRYTLYWLAANVGAERSISLSGAPAVRVRYEDLMTRLEAELQRIGSVVGEEYSESVRALGSEDGIPIRHVLAGNSLRRSGRITLRPDYRWQSGFSKAYRRLVWLLAAPVARRYGYAGR